MMRVSPNSWNNLGITLWACGSARNEYTVRTTTWDVGTTRSVLRSRTAASSILQSENPENQRADQADLPEELKPLRPDMMFRQRDRSIRRDRGEVEGEVERQGEDREQNITEIIELSETNRTKYEELARALSTIRNEKVRVTPIIVSSMGAIYGPSMKDLHRSDRQPGCSANRSRNPSATRVFA
jgi:hypothetical protein